MLKQLALAGEILRVDHESARWVGDVFREAAGLALSVGVLTNSRHDGVGVRMTLR